MCTKAFAFWLAALLAPAAEQATERVFYLTHARTAQNLQEVLTMLRAVGGIGDLSLNNEQYSVTVRGTPGEVRLAEWMVAALDQPPGAPGPQEYRTPGAPGDIFRVFYLAHAETPRELQEISTLVRSLADARYVYVCTAPRALVLRGDGWRVGLADWLIRELDQPAAAPRPPGPREYRLEGANDDEILVRVFYTPARTTQELTRILTGVRSAVQIPRSFINTARGAVILRSTAERIAAAGQALQYAQK